MTITVSIPDELMAHAAARGLSVEALVEELAREAARKKSDGVWIPIGPGLLTPEQAADEIREFRKGTTLGGLQIKELISEGRKH